MSSKSSSSSRHSSPRAMPVETIITRFKSAQQKRQLREMDRSMTKVTELLKNPLKPKMKKKVPLKKVQRSNSIISIKEDVEEEKKIKKNKAKISEKADSDEEYCPLNIKRNIVLNKVRLKPKHELKIIAQTNKRKRSVPKKGSFSQDNLELLADTDSLSRDVSPKAKRSKPHPQDMTMDEMIQLIEDSGSLNDEDLLEILTCPSPVWWEDPPDGYIEDALFTRPRSTAEMYPSIRSQLQENLHERQRSSTPNVLSRRESINGKCVSNNIEVIKNDKEESNNNNNDIDLEITLSKCDEKFIKKRNKLESVLGNLKNKTLKNNHLVSKITNSCEVNNVSHKRDNGSNKVSVIKNLCADHVTKIDGNIENNARNLDLNPKKDKQASISLATDSESTDDERLTDISFQDDAYLNDLENMNIPVQQNLVPPPKNKVVEVKKNESSNLFSNENKDKIILFAVPHFKEPINNQPIRADNFTMSDSSFNKCRTINFKESCIDPTYSDKESSIIEDYLEMKLFEEDDAIVNKKQNEYSKSEMSLFPVTPLKCINDSKQRESNLTTSVIKFKNPDNTSINVFKIEGIVPKNLPPLKNSDKKKGNTGCVPENLPPLKRNPSVIHLNSESPRSNKSTTSPESYSKDNMDSISDTNICFLNEDDDDNYIENKNANNNELEGTILSTVIKSSNVIQTNELSSHHLNNILKDELSRREESKCKENNIFPTNELHFSQDADLYKKLTHVNGVIANEFNELEFQSLTITKVNDNNCCKVEEDLNKKKMKKNDISIMKCEKEQHINIDHLTTVESKTCIQNEMSSPIQNEIRKIEKEGTECVTVYKIVSDDSGNEEPKNELLSKVKNSKIKTTDIQYMLGLKESNIHHKSDEVKKSDSNKDKMIFYFKKCKNLYKKHKISDKSELKKLLIEKDEITVNKTKMTDTICATNENNINKVINIKVNSGARSEDRNKITISENNNIQNDNKAIKNNNLTNPGIKEQKCIIVSNTKQIRYCMKCSSIFDTAQCNYCYRKNGAENKNQHATNYLLKLEKCFICEVCRYRALSKDSLERHIVSRCCDSKHR